MGGIPILSQAAAGMKELRVLTGSDPGSQKVLIQLLKAHYPALLLDSDPAALDLKRASAPVVTLGPVALRKALEADCRAPLVSALTSSQAYKRLLTASGRDTSNCTALFADAAPSAQMQLIAAVFERKVTVGVLLSNTSSYLEKPLRQAASQAGLDLQVARVDEAQDPVRTINTLSGTHVLLAVPDSSLYTPDTLRSVLESTYRRGLPVIGFSAATVTAGTLASAWSDQEDVAADLIDMLDTISSGAMPEPRYPRYWRVTINDNVARSMGLSISDRVRAMGVRPPGRTG